MTFLSPPLARALPRSPTVSAATGNPALPVPPFSPPSMQWQMTLGLHSEGEGSGRFQNVCQVILGHVTFHHGNSSYRSTSVAFEDVTCQLYYGGYHAEGADGSAGAPCG